MSINCQKLCSIILFEHFGSIVQKVGDNLLKNGSQTLIFIRSNTKIPLDKIKESLYVLIKFGFVSYERAEKGIRYKIHPDKIVLILRYSRLMFFVKKCSGDESEMMLEEFLKLGYETASKVIIKTYTKITAQENRDITVEILKDKFEVMVKNQFLIRCVPSDQSDKTSVGSVPESEMPYLDVVSLNKMIEGSKADSGDSKIYWKVNFDRLSQDFRDELIVDATIRMLDENAGELMRQLLYLMYMRTSSWAHTSNPIPFNEIKQHIKQSNYPELSQYLDQYLQLIVEDQRKFLKRVGDSGGGQYSVDVKETLCQLTWATIENIVLERFGSKAARIFRTVRCKKYIDADEIQKLAMIPAKEAKELTFQLLEHNFLQMEELKKTNVVMGLSKAYFLFHIDINQLVQMELEHCYQSLYNTMQRRNYEVLANKRMMDKKLRMDALIINLKEHGAAEEQLIQIESMMTPNEKVQLEEVQTIIKTLGQSELEIEDTLFLLQLYLRYN